MNLRFTFFAFVLVMGSFTVLQAQPKNSGDPIIPLQLNKSVLFGNDIIINNQPMLNQRQVTICSAFNGWLFAEYTYNDLYNNAAATVMKSIDNGVTWTQFFNGVFGGAVSFNSLEILVTGDSISNLKVFLAFVPTTATNPLTGFGSGYVWRYNGVTGIYEDELLQDFPVSCLALCSDFMYPAMNSNPHSIGILYTKKVGSNESLIFRSSGDGGNSLDSYYSIPSQGARFRKVALTYGRSASWSSGRYFATWEEKTDLNSNTGNIYTAYTNPDFNSPLTTPVNLSSLHPTNANMCRNPVIACQYNNIDNDSSNISEVVLFDWYDATNQRYNIKGYYNLQAVNHTNFKRLNFSDSLSNNLQPSIIFNPFESKFAVTYYDSTNQNLPLLLNNFNLANPDTWQVITPGYNDSSNLAFPYPRVNLNIGQQQGVTVWSGKGSGGKGIALFDAQYLVTSITLNNDPEKDKLFTVYPNPCSTSLTIKFKLDCTEKVLINLYNVMGKPVESVVSKVFHPGLYSINYNVTDLSSGCYILSFEQGDVIKSCKVFIIR